MMIPDSGLLFGPPYM